MSSGFSPREMENNRIASPASSADSGTMPLNGYDCQRLANRPPFPNNFESSLRSREEVRDTFPAGSNENPVPLSDSRVFILLIRPGVEDLDFWCAGDCRTIRRNSFPHEGQTFAAGRPRTWSSPSSTVQHKARGISGTADRAVSGHGPAPYPTEPRIEPRLRVVGAVEYKQLSGRREAKDGTLTRNKLKWNTKGARVSNKWGDHPPAGYI